MVKCSAGQSAITFEYVQRSSCALTESSPAQEPVAVGKPAHQAIDDELGEEIEFVARFLRKIGGSIPTVIKTLQGGSFAADILKGRIRYENDRWGCGGLNRGQPTPEERTSLARKFYAAAKKLNEVGGEVRWGKVDDAMRDRLERHRLLARGGERGRWMCDGLAVEMEKIGNQLI